jgi:ABC-type uncharacterized transport system substrate-binding protein
LGLVPNLARPGGNITGVGTLATGTTAKMVELLHELVPNAVMAGLVNPANPSSETVNREWQQAAGVVGVKLDVLTAVDDREIDMAFATLIERRAGALVVQADPLFQQHYEQLAALALRKELPRSPKYGILLRLAG